MKAKPNSDYSKFTADAPTTNDLASLSSLANDLYIAELELLKQEEAVRAAQQAVRDIAEHKIPELMDEIGVSEFTTKSGIKLGVKDVVRASIPVARREEAYAWLDERGYGDLIKHNIVVGFGRGEEGQAKTLLHNLEVAGMRTKDERKVESATLRKLVTDLLKDGADIPMDMFGANQFRRAKITARPDSHFGE